MCSWFSISAPSLIFLIGVALTADVSAPVTNAAREAGYLINAPVPGRLRLAPPAVVTDAQADAFLADLPAVLSSGADSGGTT